MIYSSVAVANTFLFFHLNETKHIEMNISRLNLLTYLAHSIISSQTKQNIIDELIIVGDYFPIYESIYRSFSHFNEDEHINSYGKKLDYSSQKEFSPIISEKDSSYIFVKHIHKNFYNMSNELIERLITMDGSPYDQAFNNEMTFINPNFLIDAPISVVNNVN